MIRFFKNILLFFLISIGIIIFTIVLTNISLSNLKSKHLIDKSVNTLILGHSHSERAFDSDIIPNALNLSQGGDSYFYIYLKVKALIKHNSQLKRIIVNFSNNQIDVRMNQRIWDDLHMGYKFVKLSAYADFDDHLLLLKKNRKSYIPTLFLGTRKNLDILITNKTNLYKTKEWGAYNKSFKTGLFLKKINKPKPTETSIKPGLSLKNLEYLEKIITICKSNNVDIFLIRTPVHKTYEYLRNDLQFDSIYNKNFKHIPFIDLKDFPLKDSSFQDAGHVNYKGSELLSVFLRDKINDGLWNYKAKSRITYADLKKL
jgi:hypothetical protein